MKSLQAQAWEIMNNFDFEYLHLFMTSNIARPIYGDITNKYLETRSWKIMTKNGFKVPSVEELKDEALSLIDEVINNYNGENYSIRTGPFKVSITYGRLCLETILIDWSFEE